MPGDFPCRTEPLLADEPGYNGAAAQGTKQLPRAFLNFVKIIINLQFIFSSLKLLSLPLNILCRFGQLSVS